MNRPPRLRELTRASVLDATPEVVWEHAMSPAGVNAELRPLLRMTFPADTTRLLDSWQPGVRLFRSWILLAGFLPVEYDDLTLVEVEPGHRFLERSSLLSQSIWEHERTITGAGDGCRIVDRTLIDPSFDDVDIRRGQHAARRHDSTGIAFKFPDQVAIGRIEGFDPHKRVIAVAENADQCRIAVRRFQVQST